MNIGPVKVYTFLPLIDSLLSSGFRELSYNSSGKLFETKTTIPSEQMDPLCYKSLHSHAYDNPKLYEPTILLVLL